MPQMIIFNKWVIEFHNRNKLKFHKKYSLNLHLNIFNINKETKFWIINLSQIRLKGIYPSMWLKVPLLSLGCHNCKIYKVIMIKALQIKVLNMKIIKIINLIFNKKIIWKLKSFFKFLLIFLLELKYKYLNSLIQANKIKNRQKIMNMM